MTRFLRHGALAGAVGGTGTALFLLLIGERSIADAIAVEQASGHGGDETFSRSVQQLGGVVGAVIVGAALGAVLAVVFAAVRHRLPGRDDFPRAVRLAVVAYVTLFLVPFVKYPANPPAVGDPATVGRRTALYLAMLAWSVAATWLGWRLHTHLCARGWERAQAGAAAVTAWAVVVGVALVVLPGSPDPVTAPATLVWRFRLASAGGQAVFWAVAGAALGWLSSRRPARSG